VGEHRECDVPVPGVVATHLVLVESDFVFGGLEAFFDGPAGSGDSDEFVVGGIGGTEAQGEGEIVGVGAAAANQRPTAQVAGVIRMLWQGRGGPVIATFAFGSLAC
jgi:hypothetical protein